MHVLKLSRRVLGNLLDLEELLERTFDGRVLYSELCEIHAAWRESPEAARQGFGRLRRWLLEENVTLERQLDEDRIRWVVFEREAVERLLARWGRARPALSRASVTTVRHPTAENVRRACVTCVVFEPEELRDVSRKSRSFESLVAPGDVCSLLHIELRTLYDMVRRKRLPFPIYKPAGPRGALRFRLSEVNDHIERSKIEPRRRAK